MERNNSEKSTGTEQPGSKRRKTSLAADINAYVPLFWLDDALIAEILGFVDMCDLTEFALCSRRCSLVRNHPLFNPERTGTVLAHNSRTFLSRCRYWNEHVFTGKRTKLRIENLGNLRVDSIVENHRVLGETVFRRMQQSNDQPMLTNVTSLDISLPSRPSATAVDLAYYHFTSALAFLLPNLCSIDLSYLNGDRKCIFKNLIRRAPNLSSIVFKQVTTGRRITISVEGEHEFGSQVNLRELDLENHGIGPGLRLFRRHRSTLTKLDIKGCIFFTWRRAKQSLIVEFVRNAPNLRWLRSDLTPFNVEMLRRERPEVQFVCE